MNVAAFGVACVVAFASGGLGAAAKVKRWITVVIATVCCSALYFGLAAFIG